MKYKRIHSQPMFIKELKLFLSTIKNSPRHRMTSKAHKITCECSLSYLKSPVDCMVSYELCRTCMYNKKTNGRMNNYDW